VTAPEPDALNPGQSIHPPRSTLSAQAAVLANNIVARQCAAGSLSRSSSRSSACWQPSDGAHGVAEIFGRQFSGYLAWLLWRTIYLSKLPGLQKKIRVALDWTLDLIFSKDLVQLPTLRSSAMSETENSSTATTHETDAAQEKHEEDTKGVAR
jgi:NADH dehydrogenase